MTTNLITLLSQNGWEVRKPATEEEINQLKEKFQIPLPEDYEQLMRSSNGSSIYGFETPFILFSIQEVLALYREHDLYEPLPHSLIFGGDGGGTIYTFKLGKQPFPVVFYREYESADNIIYQGPNLTNTLTKVINNEKLN